MKEIKRKILPIPFTEILIKSEQLNRACTNYYKFVNIAGKQRYLGTWVPNRLTLYECVKSIFK